MEAVFSHVKTFNAVEMLCETRDVVLSVCTTARVAKCTALAIFGFAVVYAGKIWYAQRLFKRLGVRTPPFRFFFGHFPTILEKSQAEAMKEWTRTYGKTYGYYEGHLPIIVTSDCALIQEVFVKQFGNFIARKIYPFQFTDDSPNMDLFLSSNKRWKRMRNIINPTFSPAKLKDMLPTMKKCSERLTRVLEGHIDQEILISDYLNRFTMDTIWNCATDCDMDFQNNPNNPYLTKSLLVFEELVHLKSAFIMTTYLSEFRPYLLFLLSMSTLVLSRFQGLFEDYLDPLFWLTQHINKIIDGRIEANSNSSDSPVSSSNKKDFIQLLIQAQSENYQVEEEEDKRVDLNKLRVEKKMSIDEIKFNLVGFLLAGFETTATALNYCFFILATHPDEVVRLQQEIDSFYSHTEIDFDNINKLEYLDMFIKEALRMYPISSNTVNRRCMHATRIGELSIPAGVSVTVDVLSLHYDPEYWGPVDTNEFYPMRFSSENKINPLAYLPFGLGPKNCLGMRFALTEMKLTLTKLLLHYDVHATANTPTKLSYIEGTVRRPKEPIPVLFKKRRCTN